MKQRAHKIRHRRGDPADQLVVILTDGMENASQEWTRDTLFRRISKLRKKGWTFVFLGANQDSYAAGSQMAMPSGNVSNFRPDAAGVAAATVGLGAAGTASAAGVQVDGVVRDGGRVDIEPEGGIV